MTLGMRATNLAHTAPMRDKGDLALYDLPHWKRDLLEQIDLLIADKSRCTIIIEKDGPAILVKPAKVAWQTVVTR